MKPQTIELRVEVPGKLRELNVQVRAEAVSITGEHKAETKNSRKGMTRSGGSMSQQISDSDSVTGAFSGASANRTILRRPDCVLASSLGKFSHQLLPTFRAG